MEVHALVEKFRRLPPLDWLNIQDVRFLILLNNVQKQTTHQDQIRLVNLQ